MQQEAVLTPPVSPIGTFVRSPMNWLFIFIPITVALEHVGSIPPPIIFLSSALAIIPIAGLIVQATEQLATRTGDAIGGLLNKQIADAMGISEIMAKVHKRNLMQKMQTRTLAELVRMAEKLGIESVRRR